MMVSRRDTGLLLVIPSLTGAHALAKSFFEVACRF